jgi:hypothetical protein
MMSIQAMEVFMKRTNLFWMSVAVPLGLVFLAGCGSSTANENVLTAAAEQEESFAATGFVLNESTTLEVIAPGQTQDRSLLDLPAGTEIAILDRRTDKELGELVRIGLDINEDSPLLNDFWITASQLPESILTPYAPADDLNEESGDLFARRKMTYCYRYVKQYLLKTGQVKVYLPGASAYMAAKILPKHGFRNTGRSPSSARDGDVCVYAGGPQGHGHIEVKRGGKWWYGYGFLPNPIRNRRFLACFAK